MWRNLNYYVSGDLPESTEKRGMGKPVANADAIGGRLRVFTYLECPRPSMWWSDFSKIEICHKCPFESEISEASMVVRFNF